MFQRCSASVHLRHAMQHDVTNGYNHCRSGEAWRYGKQAPRHRLHITGIPHALQRGSSRVLQCHQQQWRDCGSIYICGLSAQQAPPQQPARHAKSHSQGAARALPYLLLCLVVKHSTC